jgi:hypothetical protein
MKKILWIAILTMAWSLSAHAQNNTTIANVTDSATTAKVKVGDAGNSAMRMNCVVGCSGGTQNVDSGTVGGGQTTGLEISIGYSWNGSNWVRNIGDATNGLKVNCTTGCSGGTTDVDDGTVAGGQTTGLQLGLNYAWNGSNWVRNLGDGTNGLKVNCTLGCSGGVSLTDNGTVTGGQVTAMSVVVPYLWNGSNWVRQIGDATNGLKVNCTLGCLSLAQGSTTSGQVGGLLMGAVVSSASYTPGNTNPLTLDNSGLLRVLNFPGSSQGSVLAGQTATLMMGAVTTGAPTFTTATANALSLDTAGNLRVLATQSSGSNLHANIDNFTTDCAELATVCTSPVPFGVVYESSPTALTNNQVAYALSDTGHRMVTVGAGTAGSGAGGYMNVQGGGTSATPVSTIAIGYANFTPTQTTVSNTATLLEAARASRGGVTCIQLGALDVYLGGSGVTTATGYLLPGVKGAAVSIPTTSAVYGIVASSTQAVSCAEVF